MTVVITLPVHVYLGLLGRCPLSGREYAILKNSILEHGKATNGDIVEISCRMEDAELVLERAKQFYSIAAPYIESGIELARSGSGGGAPTGLPLKY
jgi:hypothetical protein